MSYACNMQSKATRYMLCRNIKGMGFRAHFHPCASALTTLNRVSLGRSAGGLVYRTLPGSAFKHVILS